MRSLDADAVRLVELAGGARHTVKAGTLTIEGAVVLGELIPVLAFSDADTGEQLVIPRHTVVGLVGDLADPPQPPPAPPTPFDFHRRGGHVTLRSPATLPVARYALLRSELPDCTGDRLRQIFEELVEQVHVAGLPEMTDGETWANYLARLTPPPSQLNRPMPSRVAYIAASELLRHNLDRRQLIALFTENPPK